jgi:mRNA interferase RelE/StbE
MRYQVLIKNSAAKALASLPRAHQRRIAAAIDELADHPRPDGARKLVGSECTWRIRVGDYRVVYDIEDRILTVQVIRVGHRKDIYR